MLYYIILQLSLFVANEENGFEILDDDDDAILTMWYWYWYWYWYLYGTDTLIL